MNYRQVQECCRRFLVFNSLAEPLVLPAPVFMAEINWKLELAGQNAN